MEKMSIAEHFAIRSALGMTAFNAPSWHNGKNIDKIVNAYFLLVESGKIKPFVPSDEDTIKIAARAVSDYIYGVSVDNRNKVLSILKATISCIKLGKVRPETLYIVYAVEKKKQEATEKKAKIEDAKQGLIDAVGVVSDVGKSTGLQNPIDEAKKMTNKILLGLGIIGGTYALFTVSKFIPKTKRG